MSVYFVVPCFNEAARWNEDYWADMLSRTNASFVFVDDGSWDGTGELLENFAYRHSSIFVKLGTNVGKAEAVRQGWLKILSAQPPTDVTAIGFIDADGAFSSQDVSSLLGLISDPAIPNHPDAWWSSRVALAGRDIQRNLGRHYLGRVVATYLSWGDLSIPYDTQSGLKLFQFSRIFQEIILVPFVTRWLFEVEILSRFRETAGCPMSIWEMPLDSWVDIAGSRVTIRESIRIAGELARLKIIQRRGRRSSRRMP